jgi:microcystin-dependent protein
MASQYLGEIRMFAGNFAPQGWAICNGATMDISQNDALFNLIGTTYGGDGQTTFNLPDLRSRAPVHFGTGSSGTTYTLGETGGTETITLTAQQIPAHNHALSASTGAGGTANAETNVPAASPSVLIYIEDVPSVQLAAGALAPAGGSQPHENLNPYLAINYIIAIEGVFPSPT